MTDKSPGLHTYLVKQRLGELREGRAHAKAMTAQYAACACGYSLNYDSRYLSQLDLLAALFKSYRPFGDDRRRKIAESESCEDLWPKMGFKSWHLRRESPFRRAQQENWKLQVRLRVRMQPLQPPVPLYRAFCDSDLAPSIVEVL